MSRRKQEPAAAPLALFEVLAREESSDRRFARWAVVVAAAVHVAAFAIQWPSFAGAAAAATEKAPKIFVVRQVKFKPPPPRQEIPQIPKPRIQRVPIPDPTPDEPEPFRDERQDEEIDIVVDPDMILGVPDAPPPPEPAGPIRYRVGGPVTPPVKTSGPMPMYPEAARRARIQGVVIIECVIGTDGRTRDHVVLKGLPLGLTEAALEAVRSWRFDPGTLDGKPVDVIYSLRVTFTLQ